MKARWKDPEFRMHMRIVLREGQGCQKRTSGQYRAAARSYQGAVGRPALPGSNAGNREQSRGPQG